jgi:hypothetical protein
MREFLLTNDGVPSLGWFVREFFVNDNGVWIQPWGKSSAGWRTSFRYWHRDISTKFSTSRPIGRDWVNHDSENKTSANFALGPVCQVMIDDRQRRLSVEEEEAVKKNITEFLLGDFRRSRSAVTPYPEFVVFR